MERLLFLNVKSREKLYFSFTIGHYVTECDSKSFLHIVLQQVFQEEISGKTMVIKKKKKGNKNILGYF